VIPSHVGILEQVSPRHDTLLFHYERLSKLLPASAPLFQISIQKTFGKDSKWVLIVMIQSEKEDVPVLSQMLLDLAKMQKIKFFPWHAYACMTSGQKLTTINEWRHWNSKVYSLLFTGFKDNDDNIPMHIPSDETMDTETQSYKERTGVSDFLRNNVKSASGGKLFEYVYPPIQGTREVMVTWENYSDASAYILVGQGELAREMNPRAIRKVFEHPADAQKASMNSKWQPYARVAAIVETVAEKVPNNNKNYTKRYRGNDNKHHPGPTPVDQEPSNKHSGHQDNSRSYVGVVTNASDEVHRQKGNNEKQMTQLGNTPPTGQPGGSSSPANRGTQPGDTSHTGRAGGVPGNAQSPNTTTQITHLAAITKNNEIEVLKQQVRTLQTTVANIKGDFKKDLNQLTVTVMTDMSDKLENNNVKLRNELTETLVSEIKTVTDSNFNLVALIQSLKLDIQGSQEKTQKQIDHINLQADKKLEKTTNTLLKENHKTQAQTVKYKAKLSENSIFNDFQVESGSESNEDISFEFEHDTENINPTKTIAGNKHDNHQEGATPILAQRMEE
jgi:hypothetical protein